MATSSVYSFPHFRSIGEKGSRQAWRVPLAEIPLKDENLPLETTESTLPRAPAPPLGAPTCRPFRLRHKSFPNNATQATSTTAAMPTVFQNLSSATQVDTSRPAASSANVSGTTVLPLPFRLLPDQLFPRTVPVAPVSVPSSQPNHVHRPIAEDLPAQVVPPPAAQPADSEPLIRSVLRNLSAEARQQGVPAPKFASALLESLAVAARRETPSSALTPYEHGPGPHWSHYAASTTVAAARPRRGSGRRSRSARRVGIVHAFAPHDPRALRRSPMQWAKGLPWAVTGATAASGEHRDSLSDGGGSSSTCTCSLDSVSSPVRSGDQRRDSRRRRSYSCWRSYRDVPVRPTTRQAHDRKISAAVSVRPQCRGCNDCIRCAGSSSCEEASSRDPSREDGSCSTQCGRRNSCEIPRRHNSTRTRGYSCRTVGTHRRFQRSPSPSDLSKATSTALLAAITCLIKQQQNPPPPPSVPCFVLPPNYNGQPLGPAQVPHSTSHLATHVGAPNEPASRSELQPTTYRASSASDSQHVAPMDCPRVAASMRKSNRDDEDNIWEPIDEASDRGNLALEVGDPSILTPGPTPACYSRSVCDSVSPPIAPVPYTRSYTGKSPVRKPQHGHGLAKVALARAPVDESPLSVASSPPKVALARAPVDESPLSVASSPPKVTLARASVDESPLSVASSPQVRSSGKGDHGVEPQCQVEQEQPLMTGSQLDSPECLKRPVSAASSPSVHSVKASPICQLSGRMDASSMSPEQTALVNAVLTPLHQEIKHTLPDTDASLEPPSTVKKAAHRKKTFRQRVSRFAGAFFGGTSKLQTPSIGASPPASVTVSAARSPEMVTAPIAPVNVQSDAVMESPSSDVVPSPIPQLQPICVQSKVLCPEDPPTRSQSPSSDFSTPESVKGKPPISVPTRKVPGALAVFAQDVATSNQPSFAPTTFNAGLSLSSAVVSNTVTEPARRPSLAVIPANISALQSASTVPSIEHQQKNRAEKAAALPTNIPAVSAAALPTNIPAVSAAALPTNIPAVRKESSWHASSVDASVKTPADENTRLPIGLTVEDIASPLMSSLTATSRSPQSTFFSPMKVVVPLPDELQFPRIAFSAPKQAPKKPGLLQRVITILSTPPQPRPKKSLSKNSPKTATSKSPVWNTRTPKRFNSSSKPAEPPVSNTPLNVDQSTTSTRYRRSRVAAGTAAGSARATPLLPQGSSDGLEDVSDGDW